MSSQYIKKLSTKNSQIRETRETREANEIPQSFFDNDQPSAVQTGFWSKDQVNVEESKRSTLMGHFFYKKSKKKQGDLKPLYICLYKNYLIASKSKEGATKQHKSLDIGKHFVILQRIVPQSKKEQPGFSLSYNNKQIDIISKNLEELNAFLYQLKKNVIQIDFEDIYILDKKLGSGSYANVYCVRDKVTRREFAAKFFEIASFKDVKRSKLAIMNEIQIHRQIEHGNICRLHEVYETSTHLIIVMEYAKGERLIDYVIDNAPLSEKESMKIIKELLEAILYLHSLGIIHRDIKLENIMINKEDYDSERMTIRLIDFGLSVTSDNIDLFKRSGTPGYVAPEILTDDTYDTQVDVFSLGVILFTMLSGRSPFVGPDRNTVLKLNKRCEYSFKPKYWENKSANCKDLVRKMMEADPQRRATALEALNHRWLAPLNPNGYQSLKTLPKELLEKKSINSTNTDGMLRLNSIEQRMDRLPAQKLPAQKSRTLSKEPDMNANKLPFSPLKKSIHGTNRSQSVKPQQLQKLSTNGYYRSPTPNLLAIPQSNAMVPSFESVDDRGIPQDGMNKGSLRSFYKLASDVNSDGAHTERAVDDGPEIAKENPNLQVKITSYREMDKSINSPFRLSSNIMDPSYVGSYQNESTKGHSCELSDDGLEDFTFSKTKKIPIFTAPILGTMGGIKSKRGK